MTVIARLPSFLRNLLLGRQVDQELDDELRAWVQMNADEKRRIGMPVDEAHRLSLVELGGLEQVKERVRDTRTGALVTGADGGRSYPDALTFWTEALTRARTVPGVQDAALTSRPPIATARHAAFEIEGRAATSREALPQAGDVLVSPAYSETLEIPMLQGRSFTDRDTGSSLPVIIISQSLARRYFTDRNPIGRRIRVLDEEPMTCCATPDRSGPVWWQVIGVVGDIRQTGLDGVLAQTVYRPYTQMVEHDMFMVVRTAPSESSQVATDLGAALGGADARRRWAGVQPMWQMIHLSESMRLRRFVLIVLGSFAATGLLLAAIGVYGVALGAVTTRMKDFAIQIALGASRPAVFRSVLREMLSLAAAGMGLGAAGAFVVARLMQQMLFGVSTLDAATYGGVALLLGLVVACAASLPAWRATRVDPNLALRNAT